MAALSKVLRSFHDGVGGEGLTWWCPGCDEAHAIYIKRGNEATHEGKGPVWMSHSTDLEKPTFSPSIKVTGGKDGKSVCHCFITNGRINFLRDCTHHMRGKIVDMVEWPFPPGTYGGIDE